MNIVCYLGGTCGDLLTCLIDSTDSVIRQGRVFTPMFRGKLKKPETFNTNEEKDYYLIQVEKKYKSIPSHDINYHILRKHDFISIVVNDTDVALWAADRFKKLHTTEIWEKVLKKSQINSVDDYARVLLSASSHIKNNTDKVINLEDILNGEAINKLQPYISTKLNDDFYKEWLIGQQS